MDRALSILRFGGNNGYSPASLGQSHGDYMEY
jgi:hypothetical protein